MLKNTLIAALAVVGSAALAAELPSAGSQLKQIPSAPVPDKAAPQLQIERNAPAIQPTDQTKLLVNRLRVINAHAFSEPELIAVTGFKPGELTLSELRNLAAKVANYYHRHGYFLAQAILPAQDIADGEVTIAVTEGKYGKITLRNHSKLADGVAQHLLNGLNSDEPIVIAPLERRLLLLADLPGVNIKSTLAPGASVGTSDLIVDVAPDQRLSGSVDADNTGSRYTGAYRFGGTLNINNPLGYGDVVTLRALTSWHGLNYGRAAYQLQLGAVQAGVAYTALDYDLGHEFSSLQAHGTAHIASVYGRYPLLRSRNNNLYTQLNFDAKTFRDQVDITAPPTITDKRAKVAMLSLIGDHRDRVGGGGLSTYSLTWSSGSLDLQDEQALIDAISARVDGHYDKFNVSIMRLQSLSESLALYAALQGQLASHNLDVSEKMGLGGADSVRAYPTGEAYVDQGYVLNVEARLLLPKPFKQLAGQLQLVGFVDSGTGSLNKDPWSGGQNRRTLSGAGLGLNWFATNNFMVKTAYAHKLGAAAATSAPDSDSRFWINASKYF